MGGGDHRHNDISAVSLSAKEKRRMSRLRLRDMRYEQEIQIQALLNSLLFVPTHKLPNGMFKATTVPHLRKEK
jgi:hypothetical protein